MKYENECFGAGALPHQELLDLIHNGFIVGASESNIKPASLDLSVSDEAYCIPGMFQIRYGCTISSALKEMKGRKYDLKDPLEVGKVYLIKLNESLDLPHDVYGYCNPKSTTGRLDLHVRLMSDANPWYDSIRPAGYAGTLWISVVPKSFSVKVSPGDSLNQLRLFNRDTRLASSDLEVVMQKYGLLFDSEARKVSYKNLKVKDDERSIVMSLGLKSSIIGFKAIGTKEVIDLRKRYDHRDFFSTVENNGKYFRLEKDKFYLFSTDENLCVPPWLACEVASMDDRLGEFRSHYAGFIDPGWGWGKEGEEKGRQITLEVRTFEDMLVHHGQPICRIKFERLSRVPVEQYDAMASHYLKQSGPTLAKQFL